MMRVDQVGARQRREEHQARRQRVSGVAVQVGQQLEGAVPPAWLWKGQHVYLVDGTTVSLPDTPENQQAFPQPPAQKPGLGFPLIRLVVLLSLATAALQGLAFGPYQGKEAGEPALLRALLGQIPPGSIILADRYYCSYFLIALLQAHGVEVVFRLHQRRGVDFRRGRRLGPDDHLVSWDKPPQPNHYCSKQPGNVRASPMRGLNWGTFR